MKVWEGTEVLYYIKDILPWSLNVFEYKYQTKCLSKYEPNIFRVSLVCGTFGLRKVYFLQR